MGVHDFHGNHGLVPDDLSPTHKRSHMCTQNRWLVIWDDGRLSSFFAIEELDFGQGTNGQNARPLRGQETVLRRFMLDTLCSWRVF